MSASNRNDFPNGVCAACGGGPLAPYLAVAGRPGAEGLAPSTRQFGTALGDIHRCAECGHMQLGSLPSQAALDSAYAATESDDYAPEEAGQRRTAAATLAAIERWRAPGALLDVGCWLGFLLAEAESRGWSAVGVEPSEYAAGYARERFGVDVRTAGLFDADLPADRFDAIVLADVIEHLPDPGAALERVAALAAPGAIVALALPNASSKVARLLGRRWWSVIPTHVQYFTRASVVTLLGRHDYEVLSLETAPKWFTVRYYLERVGGYSGALARLLVGAAERAGVADRLWGPDFRDRMLVLARAPG
jgi:SAM-dependent methyltransferase